MRNKRVFENTLLAMFMAIIFVMAYVPMLGFIQIPGLMAITIIHIPVIIAGILLKTRGGLIVGTTFGLSAMAIAFLRPSGIFDIFFQNPLVSVLPRILFGLSVYYIYKLLISLFKKDIIAVPITALISTIIHGILVLSSIGIFFSEDLASVEVTNIFEWISFILLSNTLIEGIAAAIIVTPIIKALKKL